MSEIPFQKVYGTHFVCGQQVGTIFKEQLTRYVQLCKNEPPQGMTWEDSLQASSRFLLPSIRYLPHLVDEIKGAAQGSGISFEDLFTTSVEELYSPSFQHKACTDIVCTPPASLHTVIGHTNDLPPNYANTIASVEWNFDDGMQIFSVGIGGIFVSAGINRYSLVLTGNEVSPNDVRVGIPRTLVARSILDAKTLETAIQMADNPHRASSYNNILTVPGRSIIVEGSATQSAHISSGDKNGIITHSNHYCDPKMLSFETRPNYTSSIQRLSSADKIVNMLGKLITIDDMKAMLSNHGDTGPGDNTICRHSDISTTVFAFAVDLEEGLVEITSGNPCTNPFKPVLSSLFGR